MEIQQEELIVGFVGNPNCGKTTLFNAYTGAKLKVANWPGVTVEKKEGAMKYHEHKFKLVDLPGIYSLTSYSMEEKLTREYILDDEVDVIIDVADASSLARNLYLTLQLIELGKPVILALNMMDIVEERGMEIDLHRLPEMLGIPVISVSARKRTGLDILMHAVAHHKLKSKDINLQHHHNKISYHKHSHHQEYTMVYSDKIEDKIDEVSELLIKNYKDIKNIRWHAIKILEGDEEILKKYPLNLKGIVDRSYETDIINEKYDFIDEIIEEVLVNKANKEENTDKIDKLLTGRYTGLPIFLGIMAVVFFLTFAVGDFLKEGLLVIIEKFSDTILQLLITFNVSDVLISLIVDGIIAGVGGVLTFLPNIFILFLALAILEDSGYMSRVAYIMDGIMGKLGLSGKAFIPMLLGFGCSVPAVMASRTLEDKRDKLKTVFATPFMSCSARLPIYVLFSEMFFPKYAMFVAFSMYILGLAVAIFYLLILNIFFKSQDKKLGKDKIENSLLIELPEYKSPNARTIFIYVWEKVKDYLTKAGTTIFIASIIVWFILNFNANGIVKDMSLSFGASIGKVLAPVLKPAGLGLWQVVLALISGLAAKEVVVSSFSVIFGIVNVNTVSGMNELLFQLGQYGFTALNAYVLMVFCLLYTPCVATIATIKRELKSTKMAALSVFIQLLIAWLVSTIIYQIMCLI